MSHHVLENARYSQEHEWVRVVNGQAFVGITDHAQQKLGDIVFVELPQEGQTVQQHESCAVVESVKAASDVYSPLSGTVVQVNSELEDEPGLVNQSPYDAGQLFVLENINEAELEQLMDAQAYQDFVDQEG